MPEEEKTKEIKEILVGNQKIILKESMSEESAIKVKNELKDAMNSEGEWQYDPGLLSKIETITFNPGKEEVTSEQKQIEELKRNNELLKTKISDLDERFNSLKSSDNTEEKEKPSEEKIEEKEDKKEPEEEKEEETNEESSEEENSEEDKSEEKTE